MGLQKLALILLLTTCAFAQWPKYKEARAPRLANGEVDMNGPAPKAADGKPDLSGLWGGQGRGGTPVSTGLVTGGFQNMAQNMPDQRMPYTPAGAELRDYRFGRNSKDHPDAHCLPLNPVQLWFHPQPRQLVQAAREIVFLAESNGGLRHIYLDGRKLPDLDAVEPWWFGYSVGHWEGDTLVVESGGFKDNGWVDENGSPISAKGKVTERIRRPNYGTLEITVTVDDPKFYTKVWTVAANQRLMADDELIEFVCLENEKSVVHLGQ